MFHNVNNYAIFCNPCHYFDILQYICNPFNQNIVSIFFMCYKKYHKDISFNEYRINYLYFSS